MIQIMVYRRGTFGGTAGERMNPRIPPANLNHRVKAAYLKLAKGCAGS